MGGLLALIEALAHAEVADYMTEPLRIALTARREA